MGKDVTRFKAGDRVIASTGAAGGGHAQYACLPETGAVGSAVRGPGFLVHYEGESAAVVMGAASPLPRR
ncbi:MAG: hypothetical protein MZV63_23645 [Marinilabiliales bacterium]|nr:hypothetical protein [Marinilabiliales bacterium]